MSQTLRQLIDTPQGITAIHRFKKKVKKVVMHDGDRYIFKAAKEERPGYCVPVGKRFLREAVAYQVAKLFGMYNVPETRVVKIHGEIGALQRYVDGSQEFRKLRKVNRGIAITKLPAQTRALTAAFDIVMGNTDRHRDNYFITNRRSKTPRLHLIDHGLTLHCKSNVGSIGRIVAASKNLVVPTEVKHWIEAWSTVKSILDKHHIEPKFQYDMKRRLAALSEQPTIGKALRKIREGIPQKIEIVKD